QPQANASGPDRLQPARQRSAGHFQLVTNDRLNRVSEDCPGPLIPKLREVGSSRGCGTGRIGLAQNIVNWYPSWRFEVSWLRQAPQWEMRSVPPSGSGWVP